MNSIHDRFDALAHLGGPVTFLPLPKHKESHNND